MESELNFASLAFDHKLTILLKFAVSSHDTGEAVVHIREGHGVNEWCQFVSDAV